MTETVEIKLSELREAAARLERSSQRIAESIGAVYDVMQQLMAMGLPPTETQFIYRHQLMSMEDWTNHLKRFGDKLNRAADDVEHALAQPRILPRFDLSLLENRLTPPDLTHKTPEATIVYTIDGYVSARNRPAYIHLLEQRALLEDKQAHLQDLLQSREAQANDLAALQNRLFSHDPNTNLEHIPRVQALETQLRHTDNAIMAAEGEIAAVQDNIEDLSQRLEIVKPGENADLSKIILIEQQGATGQWIKDTTQGCVNHIVNKVPIPDGLAFDAYLWDERIAQHPEYGITIGDTPLEGAVILLEREHSYADNVYGHLMYIERIENGEIWITDNYNPDKPVPLSSITKEISGKNVKFLYFPWHTLA